MSLDLGYSQWTALLAISLFLSCTPQTAVLSLPKDQPEVELVYHTFDPGQLDQLVEQNEQYFILFAVESHPCSSSVNAELENSKLFGKSADTLPLIIVRYQFGIVSSEIADFTRLLPDMVPSKDPVLVLMRGKDEISRHWVCADKCISVTAARLLGTHLQNAIRGHDSRNTHQRAEQSHEPLVDD